MINDQMTNNKNDVIARTPITIGGRSNLFLKTNKIATAYGLAMTDTVSFLTCLSAFGGIRNLWKKGI